MAQIYKSIKLLGRSNAVVDERVIKLGYKDLMNLIRSNKELSKRKLEVVENQYLALDMDDRIDEKGYLVKQYIYIPLEGHTLELLSEYHFNYYDWLINSGRANGSSLLRVLRLTSSQHVKRVAPITEDVDTIGMILAEFGLKSTDFFHNAISLATRKQMEVVFRNEDKLRDTANFLKELSANKDLADANGNKLGNNTFILSLLNSASKGFTLSPKQIASGFKTIGLYKHHANKGTALPEWKFASDESDLRKKVIRLAHQNPHLRSHLLPLVTNKVAKRIEQFYMEGQYAKGFEKDHKGVGKGLYGESFKTEKDMKRKYKELKKDDSMVSKSLVMYKEYVDGTKVEIK